MKYFDKSLRAKLDAHPSEGFDHLWSGIEQRLPNNNRSRRGLLLWLFPVFLVAILAGLYWRNMALNSSKMTPANEQPEVIERTVQAPVENQAAAVYEAPSESTTEMSLPPNEATQSLQEIPELQTLPSSNRKIALSYTRNLQYKWPVTQRKFLSVIGLAPFEPNLTTIKKSAASIPSPIGSLQDPKDCPAFGDIPKSLVIDFYINQFLPHQQLSNLSMETNSYMQLRDDTESPLYSFGAGARLSYYLTPSVYLRAGVDYSHLREVFKYNDPSTLQTRTIITIDTIFTQSGPIVRMDTSYVQIPGSRQIQEVNTLKRFSFPLTAGIEKSASNFTFSLNAGIILNLWTYSEGIILDPIANALEYGHKSTAGNELLKEEFHLSGTASLGLEYKTSESLGLFIEPHLRYTLSNLASPAYPLSQKYLETGVLFGIRKSL